MRWTDPDRAAANTAGRVTSGQRAMIIGDSRSPHFWWLLQTAGGAILVVAGVIATVLATAHPEAAARHTEAAGVLNLVTQLATFVCVLLIPGMTIMYREMTWAQGLQRGEVRRTHRQRLRLRTAALAPPRIACAIGRIEGEEQGS
ncbi:hypothetical protein [Streptomyces sp. NBC_01451]|uniref:hypothetical protein n=1 Tax=Streptomyces sp. NBC_01451 TaxID=2903872 RepID=UPI002E35739E|nr:hypothetical protein [Streptomyces sp. NBC_01451]